MIKEVEAMAKGVVRKYGTLYISQNYVCFEATVFGMASQEVIPMSKITSTEIKSKKELRINLKSKKLAFVIEAGLDEVQSLISSLSTSRADQLKEKRLTDELGLDDSGLRFVTCQSKARVFCRFVCCCFVCFVFLLFFFCLFLSGKFF